MTTSRKSKIARLPKPIRDQLNDRLEDGAAGPELLAWLNTQPEVQAILAQSFSGREITQQNLSEWRRGGYQDWLKFQAAQDLVLRLAEQSGTFDADDALQKISSTLTTVTVAQFAHTAQTAYDECVDTKQRWECVCDTQRQLSRLRRDQHRAGHLKLREERWQHELDTANHAAKQAGETEERRQMLAWFQLQPELMQRAQNLGGTDQARDLAALQLELEHNLKIGFLDRESKEFALDDEPNNSEGRVAGVPNTNPPEPSVEAPAKFHPSDPTTSVANDSRSSQHAADSSPNPQLDLSPIPLANDCTQEEFAARNHPRSTTPITTPTRRPCHRPSANPPNRTLAVAKAIMHRLKPSAKSVKPGENQEKPTKTNL